MSSNKKKKKRSNKKGEIAGNAVYSIIKIVAVVVVVMLVYRAGSIAYEYGERLFGEPAMSEEPGRDVVITVSESDSESDVGKMLEDAGLIRDKTLFVIQEKLIGFKNGIQPGTYTLNTSQTIEQMLQIMSVIPETEE